MAMFGIWLQNFLTKPDISHIIPLIHCDVVIPTTFTEIKQILKAKKLMQYYEYILDIVDFYNGTDSRVKLNPYTIQRVINIQKHVHKIQHEQKISLSSYFVLKRLLIGLAEYEQANKISDLKSVQKMEAYKEKWKKIEPEINHLFLHSKM